MPIITPGGSRVFRPPTLSEFDFNLVAQEDSVVVSQSSTVPLTVDDVNILRDTESLVDNAFDLSVVPVADEFNSADKVAFRLVGDAGQIVGNRVNRLNDGTVTVVADHSFLSKSLSLAFVRTGRSADIFQSYVSGSLGENIYSAMAMRATGKSNEHKYVYSTQNHASPQYVRNPQCWLNGIDLTCASPWNSYGGAYMAGAAISPRHMVFAWHYQIATGSTIRFITNDNQVITRTITAVSALAGGFARDTAVGLLDSDLPGTIAYAKFLPSNLEDYLPTAEIYHLPIIMFDQEEKVITKELRTITPAFPSSPDNKLIAIDNCQSLPFSLLTETIVGGDSGNPMFILIGEEIVLISLATGAGSGPGFHLFLDEINAAMTSLGGGYQLTTVDLTGFNNYG